MYELEAVTELEGEYENEFEAEGELEAELEGEFEGELEAENEAEAEAFFGSLARLAGRALRSPALRRIAQTAARAALNGITSETELEGEGEWETETSSEAILSPIRRVYPDALMEHFGHAAAEAESETEAEAFIGALVPLAGRVVARALPRIARSVVRSAAPRARSLLVRPAQRPVAIQTRLAPRVVVPRTTVALRRVTPPLMRGVTRVARVLRRFPRTRPLVRVLPTIVQRTVNTLGQRAAMGRPITPGQAVGTLARQAGIVLGSPRQAVQAYRHAVALDRRYHTDSTPTAGLCPSCRQRVCSMCSRPY